MQRIRAINGTLEENARPRPLLVADVELANRVTPAHRNRKTSFICHSTPAAGLYDNAISIAKGLLGLPGIVNKVPRVPGGGSSSGLPKVSLAKDPHHAYADYKGARSSLVSACFLALSLTCNCPQVFPLWGAWPPQ